MPTLVKTVKEQKCSIVSSATCAGMCMILRQHPQVGIASCENVGSCSCCTPGEFGSDGVLMLGRGMAAQCAANAALLIVSVVTVVGEEERTTSGFSLLFPKCNFNVLYLPEPQVII